MPLAKTFPITQEKVPLDPTSLIITLLLAALMLASSLAPASAAEDSAHSSDRLQCSELATLPNELGVAGQTVGLHNDALIVAGGANFPLPIWETEKVWFDNQFWPF